MNNLQNRYKRYKEWKLQPHQVAPLSEEQHECATCGTRYDGNYCPRCGQSAKIGRYSFKNAFLLFLDVWGLGNRGMFRSIRDLILRPGYMIRDYLRGMQMAYFPPFKMFFLLLALWLVVDSGLNIQLVNRDKQNEQEIEQIFSRFKPKVTLSEDDKADEKKQAEAQEKVEKKTGKPLTKEEKKERFEQEYERRSGEVGDWIEQHSSLLVLAGLLLAIIPIKQLSGYSYFSTIWRLVAAFIPFVIISLLLAFAAIVIIAFSIDLK